MKIKDSRAFGTELLKDLIFPARCPVCGDAIPLGKRAEMYFLNPPESGDRTYIKLYDGLICRGCLERFSFIKKPYCGKCGKQLCNEGLCTDCANKERQFSQCRCIINYDETAREIMADIKYNSKKEYIDIFAALAAERLSGWMKEKKIDCLIPVPVHRNRLRIRGYNQAEVLADGIGMLTGIPVRRDILIRNRNTTAQKELGSDARLMNLQEAFSCAGHLPNGTRALITDDIYTTGSTLEACTECLLEAGASEVFGLCICAGENV